MPSARGGGERAAGRRLRTTARDPSTRAALHALFGSFASRAYLLVGLQQSDSPTSKSGISFAAPLRSLPGKLEDCAVHQAARSAAWRGAASRSLRKLDEAHIACTHRGGLAGTSTLSLLNGGSRSQHGSQGQALASWSPPGRAVHTVHHTLILMPHQTSPRSRFRTRTRHGPVPGARDPRRRANHADAHGTHLTRRRSQLVGPP